MSLVTAENRSQEVQDAAALFEMGNLVNPDARQIAISFARLAQELVFRIRGNSENEGLLADALEQLYDVRKTAIKAILPPARRQQWETQQEAQKPVRLEEPEDEGSEEPEDAPEKPVVRKTTRSKTTSAAR